MILYAQHIIGLRKLAEYPRVWEIAQNWAAFTIVFQLVIPRFPKTFTTAGDPYDILAYLAGGIIAGFCWTRMESGSRSRGHEQINRRFADRNAGRGWSGEVRPSASCASGVRR